MRIPKKVNVCGHDYHVRIVDPMKMQLNAVGECSWPDRQIKLSKLVSKEIQFLSLLHEIRHAYQFEMGMTQVLQAQTMEMDCEGFASLVMSLKAQKVL